MTSRLRHEYQRACAYLGSLQDCLDALERIGVSEPWSTAMRHDVRRLAHSLQSALDAAERETGRLAEGSTAPERRAPSALDIWGRAQDREGD